MDDGKIITPETFEEKLIAALAVGSVLAENWGHEESAQLLLELRKAIQTTYRPVWTNGKAIRRYQGQDVSHSYLADTGWHKKMGIFLDEKV